MEAKSALLINSLVKDSEKKPKCLMVHYIPWGENMGKKYLVSIKAQCHRCSGFQHNVKLPATKMLTREI